MKSEEIKPCPFCGCAAQVVKRHYYYDLYGVFCNSCLANIGQFNTTPEKAIEAWNRRVHEPRN